MKYWIMNTDHNLWKIVQNGNNKKSLGRDSKRWIIILPPVFFEEHVDVQRETKARTLLLQSLPKDHMADFHHLDDAREIWLAVKARFGDFADHAGNVAGSVYDAAAEFDMMGISPKEGELKESLARFDKWKESSKHLTKLIKCSMSSRTKLGLRFKESIGSDEVFDLSIPSVFDPKHENREVKALYERFVKAGEMHEVPPSIIGTFMPTSYKSDLEETQVTFGSKSNTFESNDFVSCDNSDKSSESETYDYASWVSNPKTNDSFSTVDVKILPMFDVKDPSPTDGFPSCSFKENVKPLRNLCNKSGIADRIHCKNNFVHTNTCFVCGSKSHLIKDCDVYDNVDNFPYVVLKVAYVLAGSRNSSASISAGRSIHAASRNRPASIHAGRHFLAGRFNRPSPFLAGRSVPTGWTNHAARPFFRPTNLYFDNISLSGSPHWDAQSLDQMLLFYDPAVFDVPADCSCWFPYFCWFLVAIVWLFAAVLFRSCCWNKVTIRELSSEDLSRILKLTLSNSRLGEDC
nr:xylulose kinase-1 [Tanacetum cinerariifolium]